MIFTINRLKQCAVTVLGIVAFTAAAPAAPMNVNDWHLQPDQGQVYFANLNTELDIVGPAGAFSPSYDGASFVAPPAVAGQWQVTFHWDFNAGDSVHAQASLNWTGGGNSIDFASGGPGSVGSGDYSFLMNQGDTADFFLFSDPTGAGKQAPAFVITSFQAVHSIPDATPWISVALVLPLLAGRLRYGKRHQ